MKLDRFYTPRAMATALLNSFRLNAASCVDPACGDGALLRAAETRFEGISCFGLDIDRQAVAAARRRAPHWVLSSGDLLAPASRARTTALAQGRGCDIVVCNPPFSMGARKGVRTEFLGGERSSVAMAHILAAMDVVSPKKGLAAVVPESLVFSDLDAAAREKIQAFGRIDVVGEGRNTAFSGARVNTLLVRVTPKRRRASPAMPVGTAALPCSLYRGGLPVHEAEMLPWGTRYVHTTDFQALHTKPGAGLPRVRRIGRGVVKGHLVLLPRVGLPREHFCRPLHFREQTQLSDCVFALQFSSARRAAIGARLLRQDFDGLSALYRGTGARYITQARLEEWLGMVGFELRHS